MLNKFTRLGWRAGWRQLLADPAFSAIVIVGLSAALTVCYLIGLLMRSQLLPDPVLPDPQRVVSFDFKSNMPGREDEYWTGQAPFALYMALAQPGSPVTQSARVQVSDVTFRAGTQQSLSKLKVAFSDADIVSLFGLKAIQGDVLAALKDRNSVALSQRGAERLFGNANALGQQVLVAGSSLTIRAVVPNPANNSLLPFDALMSFEAPANSLFEGAKEEWYTNTGQVYGRLMPGATVAQLSEQVQALLDQAPGMKKYPPAFTANGRKAAFLRAVPLVQVPFEGPTNRHRMLVMTGLAVSALVMLLLACINYVNLSTVRTLRRQREFSIRKSLGASPSRLFGQFVLESSFVTLAAGLFALALAWVLAPSFGDWVEMPLQEQVLDTLPCVSLMLTCIVLGILTAVYPARVAIHTPCAEALSGRGHSESAAGKRLRQVLTALQFAAAMLMAGLAVVVMGQARFMETLDNGFKTEGLLAITMPGSANAQTRLAFQEALAHQSAVSFSSWGFDALGSNPGGIHASLTKGSEPHPVYDMRYNEISENFFSVYQIPLLAGQVIKPSATDPKDMTAVIDLGAVHALGLKNPQDAIGLALQSRGRVVRVVGVSGRVKQEGARGPASPQLFRITLKPNDALIVRGPSNEKLRKTVLETWPRYFPNEIADVDSVSNIAAALYKIDSRYGSLIAMCSVLALLLAGFGVYALAAYTVRRNTREIVLRKLHGASGSHIVLRLAREFAPLLALGALVGLGAAWYLGQHYQSNFVAQAQLGVWPFALALGLVLLMTILAATRHIVAALKLRPVLALSE